MDELMPAFRSVFVDVFGDEEIEIERSTTAAEVEGWDSLMHINLVVATEKAFGVRFATAEISALKEDGKNVGSFLDLLREKLAARR